VQIWQLWKQECCLGAKCICSKSNDEIFNISLCSMYLQTCCLHVCVLARCLHIGFGTRFRWPRVHICDNAEVHQVLQKVTREVKFGKFGTIPMFSFHSALAHHRHHQIMGCQLRLLYFKTWDGRLFQSIYRHLNSSPNNQIH
jgi:hypothetical protein